MDVKPTRKSLSAGRIACRSMRALAIAIAMCSVPVYIHDAIPSTVAYRLPILVTCYAVRMVNFAAIFIGD